jgi:hypothetical protein
MTGTNGLQAGQNLSIDGALVVSGVLSVTARSDVDVGAGGAVTFSGAGSVLSGTLLGSGAVDFVTGSDTFAGLTLAVATMSVNLATVTIEGMFNLQGRMIARSNALLVGSGGATFTGGGTLALTDVVNNKIEGAVAGATILNRGDTLTGAGVIGGGYQGQGDLRLVNASGGVIDGDGSALLEINTGVNNVTNDGLIEATGTGGVRIDTPVLGVGDLEANGGTLVLTGAVGPGQTTTIENGAVDFLGAYSGDVQFTGATGQLLLARSTTYSGTIWGFSATGGATLDLRDLFNFNGVSYSGTASGGTLSVTRSINGQAPKTVSIKLSGDYLSTVFSLTDDGQGGVIVEASQPTDRGLPAEHSSAQAFVAAMSGLGAGSSVLHGASHAAPGLILAAPVSGMG